MPGEDKEKVYFLLGECAPTIITIMTIISRVVYDLWDCLALSWPTDSSNLIANSQEVPCTLIITA